MAALASMAYSFGAPAGKQRLPLDAESTFAVRSGQQYQALCG